jgi:hypothetical protein
MLTTLGIVPLSRNCRWIVQNTPIADSSRQSSLIFLNSSSSVSVTKRISAYPTLLNVNGVLSLHSVLPYQCNTAHTYFTTSYSNRHQITYFKATERFHPPNRAALNQQYRVVSFATLRVLSCLHSPGLRCSCYNVVRLLCDLEACNLQHGPARTWIPSALAHIWADTPFSPIHSSVTLIHFFFRMTSGITCWSHDIKSRNTQYSYNKPD